MDGNPISDKRLLKLIQQCHSKQVLDYVKKNGADADKSANNASKSKQTPAKGAKSKQADIIDESAHKIIIKPHSTEDFTVSRNNTQW